MKSNKKIMTWSIIPLVITCILFSSLVAVAESESDLSQLIVTLITDKISYEAYENVTIKITVTNTGKGNITQQAFPFFKVFNEQGEQVYFWIDPVFLVPESDWYYVTIPAGKSINFLNTTWRQIDNNRSLLPGGYYTIKGGFGSKNSNTVTVYLQGSVQSNPTITLTTDKTSYNINETVMISIKLTNTRDEDISFLFMTGKTSDFEVLNEQGEQIYLWSDGKAFTQATWSKTINPGETLFYYKTWDQKDRNGNYLPKGNYTIRGWVCGFSSINVNAKLSDIVAIHLEGVNSMPGFELLTLIVALGITFIILKRKRD